MTKLKAIMLLLGAYVFLPLFTVGIYARDQYLAWADAGIALSAGLTVLPGVVMYFWLLNQFITGCRVKWVERILGMPGMIKVHIINLIGVLVLVVWHAIVRGIPGLDVFDWLGVVAIALFLVVTLISVVLWIETPIMRIPFVRRIHDKYVAHHKGSNYEILRLVHNLVFLGAVAFYLHVVRSDMSQGSLGSRIMFHSYFALTMWAYVLHKVIRPRLIMARTWTMTGFSEENEDVLQLEFTKDSKDKKKFDYQAGQFGFFVFYLDH